MGKLIDIAMMLVEPGSPGKVIITAAGNGPGIILLRRKTISPCRRRIGRGFAGIGGAVQKRLAEVHPAHQIAIGLRRCKFFIKFRPRFPAAAHLCTCKIGQPAIPRAIQEHFRMKKELLPGKRVQYLYTLYRLFILHQGALNNGIRAIRQIRFRLEHFQQRFAVGKAIIGTVSGQFFHQARFTDIGLKGSAVYRHTEKRIASGRLTVIQQQHLHSLPCRGNRRQTAGNACAGNNYLICTGLLRLG